VPVITGISPPWFYLDGPAIVGGIQINGTGFAGGEILHVTPLFGDLTLSQGTSATQIVDSLGIGSNMYSPGSICFSVTTTQGITSNAKCTVFVGNQNTLAIGSTGKLLQFDPAQGLLPTLSNGFIRKFNADGTPDGSLYANCLSSGIAVDDKTGGITTGYGTIDINGNVLGIPAYNDGNPATPMGVAAKGGEACVTRPSGNMVSCYAAGQNGAPLYSATIGIQPWSLTMVKPASELDAIVYSRGDATLWRVSVLDMTIRGSVALSGIAHVTSDPGVLGGWQVASGSLGKVAVVLAQADDQLVFVDIGTMSVTKQVNLKTLLGTGNVFPIRVAFDEPRGRAFVAVGDGDANLARFVSIDSTTGAMTTIAATSTLFAIGFGISADGTTLYSCERAACNALPTSAVQPKAMTGSTAAAHARAAAPTAAFTLSGGSGATTDATNLVPEITLSASRTETKPGKAVFLSWSARDVTSCFAFSDWQGPRPIAGAETILPAAEGTYTYNLACTGKDGDAVKSVTVVARENPAVVPPTLEASVSPAKVRVGEPAAIRWSTTDADSCAAEDLGNQPVNGSAFAASPIPGSFTRTITCKGPGGIVSRQVTLTVTLPNLFDLF
jgi:hypothetical protein